MLGYATIKGLGHPFLSFCPLGDIVSDLDPELDGIMDTLGQRIQELRRRRGWTQERLAQETGLNRNSLACYETDRHRPPPRSLRKLAFSLEVSPVDLDPELSPVFAPPEAPPRCVCGELRMIDLAALEKLRGLPEADASRVLALIIELEGRLRPAPGSPVHPLPRPARVKPK